MPLFCYTMVLSYCIARVRCRYYYYLRFLILASYNRSYLAYIFFVRLSFSFDLHADYCHIDTFAFVYGFYLKNVIYCYTLT